MEELISIIIPIYGVEAYLERCVNSVLNQVYTNIEIILVDDGSPDRCGEICDKFALEDSRVVVLHKKNGGLSDARNAGLTIAKGNWIAFVDSDDCISRFFIKFLYEAAIESNCQISQCMYKRFSDQVPIDDTKPHDVRWTVIDAKEYLHGIDSSNRTAAWNKLYSKSLFDGVKYPKGRIHEDVATTYRLVSEIDSVCVVDEKLYYYYINENSITKSKIKDNKLDLIDAYLEQYHYFHDVLHDDLLAYEAATRLTVSFGTIASYPKEKYLNYNSFIIQLENKYKKLRPQLLAMKKRTDLTVLLWICKRHLKPMITVQKIKKLIGGN